MVGNSRIFGTRRGIGNIVGGAIIAAILFTAVYTYFYVILQAEVTRGMNERNTLSAQTTKQTEQLTAVAYNNSGTVGLIVNNTGPVTIQLVYMNAYKSNSIPLVPPSGALSTGLNSGKGTLINTSLKANSSTYTLTLVTSRGNLDSAKWPPVVTATTQNVTNISANASESAIASHLGSLEIDAKGLGYIQNQSPGTHDGTVDNRGWLTKFTSHGAKGYPAFYVPGGNNMIMTITVRNIEPSGQNMTLSMRSALFMAVGGEDADLVPPVYLCYVNSTNTLYSYSENTAAKVVLPNVYAKASNSSAGWTELFFCAASIGTTNSWSPQDPSGGFLTPVFLVLRGEFGNYVQYSQTIPFQATTLTDSSFTACIKAHGNGNDCTKSTGDQYTGISKTSGQLVDIKPSGGAGGPYTVTWTDTNGNVKLLLLKSSCTACTVTIPNTSAGYYIMQIIDSVQNVVPMTFKLS